MIGKFIIWFVVFGLSFLVEKLGWGEQGKTFFAISITADVSVVLSIIIVMILIAIGFDMKLELGEPSALFLLKAIATLAIVVLTTLVASKLFDVNFFVAYQIMSFGYCICAALNEKKKKE